MSAHVAVRDALLERNRGGGLRGYRLELVSLDDWDDPAIARRRAAELLIDPLVVAAILWPAGPARAPLDEGGLATLELAPGGGAAAARRVLAAVEAAAADERPTRPAVRARLRVEP